MKHVILCLLSVAGLAGCGTTSTVRTEPDYEQATAIQRVAQRNGVQVIWVNFPTRVVRASGN